MSLCPGGGSLTALPTRRGSGKWQKGVEGEGEGEVQGGMGCVWGEKTDVVRERGEREGKGEIEEMR